MTDTQEEKPRLKLNAVRLTAGTLAAVTAAALSSRLGVAGTLAGTGLVSLVSGAAATVYEHSVERGRAAMRKAVDGFHPPRPLADRPAERTRSPRLESGSTRRRWALAGAGALATFAVAIGIITGIEAADGQALSGKGHHTTLGAAFGGSHHRITHQQNRPPTKPTPGERSTSTPTQSPTSSAPSSRATSPSQSPTSSGAPSPSAPPTTAAPTPSPQPTATLDSPSP